MANSFPVFTICYNLSFWGFFNQDSYNPRLFKKEYPVLRLAVNILIDVGGNDLIRTQIFTELGRRHYFTGNFTETT